MRGNSISWRHLQRLYDVKSAMSTRSSGLDPEAKAGAYTPHIIFTDACCLAAQVRTCTVGTKKNFPFYKTERTVLLFVVENGKRTDTKRIAHGYRKERPVPFCFPFRSVYFLFVSLRSIPFTTCAPLQLKFSHSRCFQIFDGTLSATLGPVQFNLRARLLHTRCTANLLPVAQCSSTDVREIRVILLRSSALYSLFGGRTRFFSWYTH